MTPADSGSEAAAPYVPLAERCSECLCPECFPPDSPCPACHGRSIGTFVREHLSESDAMVARFDADA